MLASALRAKSYVRIRQEALRTNSGETNKDFDKIRANGPCRGGAFTHCVLRGSARKELLC